MRFLEIDNGKLSVTLPVKIPTAKPLKKWERWCSNDRRLAEIWRLVRFEPHPTNSQQYFIWLVEMSDTGAHASVRGFLSTNWTIFQDRAQQSIVNSAEVEGVPPILPPTVKARSPLVVGNTGRKPDGLWREGNENTIVLEVGYSENEAALANDAVFWLKQGMKCVITVKLTRGKDVDQITALRISGSRNPTKSPKFGMKVQVWLPQHSLVNPPISKEFGNSGNNRLRGTGEKFLVVPLAFFFLDPPATADQNAVDLVPPPQPIPQPYNPVWSVELFDLQQDILQRALLDGQDGDKDRPMTYY